MKRREYHLGPGAASLILLIVVTSMSILGLLSLMNARADLQMARRSARVTECTAALDAASEEDFARLDALAAACGETDDAAFLGWINRNLPEGMALEGRVVRWVQCGEDGRTLECGVEIAPVGETPRIKWIIHRHCAELGGELEL